MDWISVAKMIVPFAPALGGVLGGFIPVPGGALAGQAIGAVIARAFGVEATPAAVAGAIQNNPNEVILAKLVQATEMAKAEYPAFATVEKAYFEANARAAEAVNRTMQAEIGHEHWFFNGWRPACGWVFVLMNIMFGAVLIYATLKAVNGDDKALVVITNAWPVYLAYFGTLAAMVGVYVIGRSKEKSTVIATTPEVKTATPPVKPVLPGKK